MAADDTLLTLSELLSASAPSSAARRAPGTPATMAPPAAARTSTPHSQLHTSLQRELSAVDALFSRWHADVEAKQRSAASACDFPDAAAFSAALLVLNKRGERRRGARAAQEWYFAPRHASGDAGPPCSRCCLVISRRQTYYVDRAAATQADEVCRRCMLCMMRGLLGQDDADILQEAQRILDSAWGPSFNPALLQSLPHRRTLLAEL